jgi:hypothetical protein
MESHKAGFPPFPHSLEIPSGFPHSHGLDDEIRYLETTAKTSPGRQLQPLCRKGLVTDVPGTLNSEFGVTIRSVGLGCVGKDGFSG